MLSGMTRRTLLPLLVSLVALGLVVRGQTGRHVILITIDGFANFHLKNPAIDLPTIRALARSGVEAQSSETIFPSVTHPSHTTLLTGVRPLRHGVINNRLTNRITGERFHVTNLDRTVSVKVPTLFDVARRGGLSTAAFFWPETKNDPSIDFLLTDQVQHEVGPAHYRAHAALTAADHAVSVLVDAVREAGIAEQTTFVVTADHGFATIDKQVNLTAVFADPVLKDAVKLHPQGWSLFVEKTPAFDAARHQAALDRAYQRAATIAGVATIIRSAEFHALGIPTYDESPFIAGQDMLVGEVDTILTADAANPSTARVPLTPPRHEHGYLPTHPKMYTSLVLSGQGVKKGATIGHVRSLDVAPTIARLWGIEMKDVEGRVLTEALQ